MIIGFTGRAGCGKTTAAKHLKKKYGFDHYNFSDVLADLLEDQGKKPTKLNMSVLGDKLRDEEGNDVMAKYLTRRIDSSNAVITGFRSPAEVDYVRQRAMEFHLIFVKANLQERMNRVEETQEELNEREEKDVKKGMEEVFLIADKEIDNNGSLEHFHEQINKIMDEIEIEGE